MLIYVLSGGSAVVGESARMSFRKLSGKSGSPGINNYRTSGSMSVLTDESASIMSMKRTSNINMSMNMSMRNLGNLSSARWSEECGLTGSHAATLDRLFAWEKKLYLEVKVCFIPTLLKPKTAIYIMFFMFLLLYIRGGYPNVSRAVLLMNMCYSVQCEASAGKKQVIRG